MKTRFTICRQCPDQPLRVGTAGSEANRNVGAAGRRSANVTAGPCVSAPKIVKASGKDQVSGLLDGLRRSLARRLPVSHHLAAASRGPLLPAAGKLTGQPKMRPSTAHFGILWSRYRLIWVAELAAAGGDVIGLWWHPLGAAAAAGMALLLIGALITHRRAEDGGEGDRAGPARPRDHARRRGRTGRAGFGGGLQPLGAIRFPAGAGWFG